MAEGVCPKTQDTRGMSTLVSSCATRHVPYRSRQGIFPRFSRSRRVFPRSEIFVCLRLRIMIESISSRMKPRNEKKKK